MIVKRRERNSNFSVSISQLPFYLCGNYDDGTYGDFEFEGQMIQEKDDAFMDAYDLWKKKNN